MIKYLVFDLDGTLIRSQGRVSSLIAEFLEKKFGLDQEATRYYFHSMRGKALLPQLIEYVQISEQEAQILSEELYALIRQSPQGEFFPGVIEVIKQLSQNFRLFLSTGNSEAFALGNLEAWGILHCFDAVKGSDVLQKGVEHIHYFIQETGDADFAKYAVWIWDGEYDAQIAHEANMPFIHIEEEGKCSFGESYCVKSVAEILPVLQEIIQKNWPLN